MTRIIGLTGGIGSGKSTVASYIASKGIPVYIADEEAKKLMDSKKISTKIQAIFSENILTIDGTLDRKKIAAIVFNSPEKLSKLNAIVHPEVKKHFRNWLNLHKKAPFIIKEVAILFETGGNLSCDKVILVTAPEEIRIQRAMKRDNVDRDSVLKRIQNQLPEEEKISKSDFVVHNIDLQNTFIEIDQILKILAKP
ncbi:MAG: dephospho-CoA kinase [Flavobacterium sp.]|uniref:Dephospho-CoA kinase n=1 Tax=Flavobacterium celericrescens TaxID=2709780 RepID=A0ABX0I9G0_9FLAO|nr:dephospho-CoA kinase [Flavobacterium celericrescens]NHM03819.1 dephospho-CoA kinase [Flavobacterium celericrescens]